ncbi:MAG: DUF2341 domain-containing protein [Candidatus Hodarchaeota archaeon]
MRKKQAIIAGMLLFVLVINLGIITSILEDILRVNSLTVQVNGLESTMNPIFEDKRQSSIIALLDSNDKTSNHSIDESIVTPSVFKWADDRFKYRKNITVPFSKITKDLTNFPVLIDLRDPDLKNVFQPSGNDILFTDASGTQLDHEIELFNQTYNKTHGQLVTWVRGNLSSTKDTIFSMYYGNPSVTTQENPEGVWKNDFTAVWHLSETSGPRYDSTSNNIDGSPQNYENDEASLGKIAGAEALDGSDDYIETYKYPDEIGLGGKSAKTVTVWVYTNKFDGGGVFEFGQYATKGLFSLQTHSSDNLWIGKWWGDKNTFKYPSLNTWVYLTLVYDGNTVYIYANSELQINSSKNLNTGNKITLKIGSSNGTCLNGEIGDDSSNGNCLNCFNGLIDEMRISTTARSAAWIQTEFLNQFDPDSFYSISTQQTDNNSPSITDFGVNIDHEDQLTFYAVAIDDFTSVEMVTIAINGSLFSMAKNESGFWVYQHSPVNFGDYFIFWIVNASDSFGNYMSECTNEKYYRFTFDFTPPQVIQAYFIPNDRLNPTNLTFYAEIKESGSGIEDIILFYYFEAVIIGDVITGSGSGLLQETDTQWLHIKMEFYKESTNNYIYTALVPFPQNKGTWKLIYRIAVSDKNGNINENAFVVDPHQAEKDIIIVYSPLDSDINLFLVLLSIFLIIICASILSIVYNKLFRKPGLIGPDRKLILKRIDEIDNMELMLSIPNHTLGIIVSIFDEEKGPVPQIVIPRSLKNDHNMLLSLSFRAFSNCEFVVDPNRINQATFSFTTAQNTLIKVLSYSFALKRPSARGGVENVVLSVLILPDVFPIVNLFSDMFFDRIRYIHKLLDQKPEEEKQIFFKILELQEYISQIILSYYKIYGNSEYFPQ